MSTFVSIRKPERSRRFSAIRPNRHRGVVLFIALIALVALSLAGIALLRSVNTSNVIAGNFAFKQTTVNAADVGIQSAYSALPNIIATSLDTDISNQYFATMQPVDASGIPTTINWSAVPGNAVAGGNTVKYVIERLCRPNAAAPLLPVANVETNCVVNINRSQSNDPSDPVFTTVTAVYYRVTVQVTGPRGTVSVSQSNVSF